MRALDAIDRRIVRLLQLDGRISNATLAKEVGLSPSACLRRVQLLEHDGVIRGYTALVEETGQEPQTVVIVQITLEKQTEAFLSAFEAAVRKCPDVMECYLMSGGFDYLLRVAARGAADYERIHKDQLSLLPGVARIHSSFAIRSVIRAGNGAG
ncbi:Lrp/AsnC family transcriptional regulator [Azospirillum sp. RWY-5-1]|uniref:Lrp/AsnC family transcriptional regulator n=1 Tax=Azospirillum oleiclasticum TaxID=2735135 RepID=A0ABX2TGY1_9PROT|nr:Lrp/AsnC family transcriptional regulator [Azospirillum oleiclasticum]NYZ15909.1 Lrp/AsnC family transcriptional regulator [Azospirillum oleiclasticum]NYZ23612.1 Lrp/AsnC family transcriptional regulator [Azospirillum oleiclasticum]